VTGSRDSVKKIAKCQKRDRFKGLLKKIAKCQKRDRFKALSKKDKNQKRGRFKEL